MRKRTSSQGFTLIELLLVIAIIAVLAAIVIVAINPTRQLGSARNAQRESDVNTILNAVYQYTIDNSGRLPGYLSGATVGSAHEICMCNATSCETRSACGLPANTGRINLRELTGAYVVSIPNDPSVASGASTEYAITREANNRITVSAPGAEQSATISVTR